MKTLYFALLGGLAVAGCASAPADHRGDVRQELTTRVGPIWATPLGPIASAVDKIVAEPLTIDSATRLALTNHPRVRATLARLDVAEADLAQAGLLANPAFDVEVRLLEGGDGISLDAAVTQNVLNVFALPLRKRLAEGEYAVARREILLSLLDLVRDARVALVGAQAATEQTSLRERMLELATLRAEYAHHVHDAGNITDLQLALIDADAEQARADLVAARSAEVDARERLNVALGLFGPAASAWKVVRLPEVAGYSGPLDAIEADAVRASVLLERDRAALEAGETSLGFQRAFAWGVDLDAGASATKEEGQWGFGPAIGGTIPLFDTGSARVARARATLDEARAIYAAHAIEVRSAARTAREQLELSADNLTRFGKVVVPLQERITWLSLRNYNAMQIDAMALLNARRSEVRLLSQAIDARRDYAMRLADLAHLRAGGRPRGSAGSMMTAMPQNNASGDGH